MISNHTSKPPRVALYLRSATFPLTPEHAAREQRLHAFAERVGKVGCVFRDLGRSGMDRHRPGLQELLRAVEGGEVTTVIVQNLSSLSRSIAHLHEIMERMRRYGCALISLDERRQLGNAGVRA